MPGHYSLGHSSVPLTDLKLELRVWYWVLEEYSIIRSI